MPIICMVCFNCKNCQAGGDIGQACEQVVAQVQGLQAWQHVVGGREGHVKGETLNLVLP